MNHVYFLYTNILWNNGCLQNKKLGSSKSNFSFGQRLFHDKYKTIEELYNASQNNHLEICIFQWDSYPAVAPVNNDGIVFIGNWNAFAITYTGKMFILDGNTMKWVEL